VTFDPSQLRLSVDYSNPRFNILAQPQYTPGQLLVSCIPASVQAWSRPCSASSYFLRKINIATCARFTGFFFCPLTLTYLCVVVVATVAKTSGPSSHVHPWNVQSRLPFPLCRPCKPSCPNSSRAPTSAARPSAQRSRQTSVRSQCTEGKEHQTSTRNDEECAGE